MKLSKAKLLPVAVVLFCAALVTACQDLPTEPMHPDVAPVAALPNLNLPIPGGLDLGTQRRSANKDDLKEALKQEKAKIRARKQSLKALHELRVAEWKVTKKAAKKVGGLSNVFAFLTCEPLEYDAAADIIGPEGGKLSVGPHELKIPKGALSEYVLITAELPISDMVEVRFAPHGLEFARSADLSLSYKHCYAPRQQRHWLVYIDGSDTLLEWLISQDKKGLDEVTGDIDHFSRYAVVAN